MVGKSKEEVQITRQKQNSYLGNRERIQRMILARVNCILDPDFFDTYEEYYVWIKQITKKLKLTNNGVIKQHGN